MSKEEQKVIDEVISPWKSEKRKMLMNRMSACKRGGIKFIVMENDVYYGSTSANNVVYLSELTTWYDLEKIIERGEAFLRKKDELCIDSLLKEDLVIDER